MKRRLIYIAGAGHSGSTLLEMIVSGADKHHGLGEIFQLADQRNPIVHDVSGHRCSCGQQIDQCQFWAPTIDTLRTIPRHADAARYLELSKRFATHFGDDHVLIDSSKVPEGLLCAAGLEQFDILVLHIVRDLRAWTISMQNSYERNKMLSLKANVDKFGTMKGSMKYFMRQPLVDMRKWHHLNRKIEETTANLGLRRLVVSYERLCFDTPKMLSEISEFIEADVSDYGDLEARNTNHSIFGNRMRFDPQKLREIRYDDAWMQDDRWLLPFTLSPGARKFSRQIGQ